MSYDNTETKADPRMKVQVLGRELGTASGWDSDLGQGCVWFYDFVPAEGVSLPSTSCLTLNEEAGLFYISDEADKAKNIAYDAIEVLGKISTRLEMSYNQTEAILSDN